VEDMFVVRRPETQGHHKELREVWRNTGGFTGHNDVHRYADRESRVI
jgi:hypothetical protein